MMNTGAAVATTPTGLVCALFFGNTAVSLATAEAAAAKAPRRQPLGMQSWAIGDGPGVGPKEGNLNVQFANPIVVNPGEFVGVLVRALAGTATSSQVIYYVVSFDYGWV
jgi:hypothetical protein